MRERNTTSGAGVAGLTLMRLGPELTFLAWNDRGGQDATQNVMQHMNFATQNIGISAIADMLRCLWVCITGSRLAFDIITGISYQPSQ